MRSEFPNLDLIESKQAIDSYIASWEGYVIHLILSK